MSAIQLVLVFVGCVIVFILSTRSKPLANQHPEPLAPTHPSRLDKAIEDAVGSGKM